MNMEKLTTKTREALMAAHDLAVSNGNTELRNLHVLAALVRQENGLNTEQEAAREALELMGR